MGSDSKKINSLWGLNEDFTVPQAAALIAGVDPHHVVESGQWSWEKGEHLEVSPEMADVQTAFAALVNAINAGKLRALVRRDAHIGAWDEDLNFGEAIRQLRPNDGQSISSDDVRELGVVFREAPNWVQTTVERSDLLAWLQVRGFRPEFFFPTESSRGASYLDPQDSRYAPKLAAAVRAWIAVGDDLKGKSPKMALERWLREHAAEFGMTNDDGNPVAQAVEDCSKVANWQPGGGSPKTPGS